MKRRQAVEEEEAVRRGGSSGDEVVTAGAVRLGVGATWGSFPSIPI